MSSNERREKAKKSRRIFACIIVLFDILILPWIMHFPQFLINSGVNAPTDWFHFGIVRSIKDIFIDPLYLRVFLMLQIGVIAAVIGVLWNVNTLGRKNKIQDGVGGPEAAGSGQFGTSRWQTEEEADKTFKVWHTHRKLKKGGIIFGMEKDKVIEKIWLDDDDKHTLIIGATRSGKDRKILLPSIWELAKAEESMIIGDPKGEMYITTKDYLEKEGYNVIALNLRDPLKGNQWNLLNMVNRAIDEGDTAKASEHAWKIANIISKQTPSAGGEPIWKNGGQSTIAALILLAALESEFKFQRHITTAYYLLSEYGQPLEDDSIPLVDYIKSLPTRHPAKAAFATASIAPYKTRASFFTTVLSDLRLFSDPKISCMTSNQDHDFERIGIDKTAVFLIIPDEDDTKNSLATLYVSQAYQALVDLSNREGGRIPRRVNIILNEFGNLPEFPDFPTMLTVGGGRGVRFTIAVQDDQQIKRLYKESSKTITGNCHNWIFLRTADVETAKLVSAKIGKYTVETDNITNSLQSTKYSSSMGNSLTGRALLMEDEILRWKTTEGLIIPVGEFPARLPMPDLSEWEANTDFGFVEPSGDMDRDKEANKQIIKRRWESLSARELEEPQIWLPEIEGSEDEETVQREDTSSIMKFAQDKSDMLVAEKEIAATDKEGNLEEFNTDDLSNFATFSLSGIIEECLPQEDIEEIENKEEPEIEDNKSTEFNLDELLKNAANYTNDNEEEEESFL